MTQSHFLKALTIFLEFELLFSDIDISSTYNEKNELKRCKLLENMVKESFPSYYSEKILDHVYTQAKRFEKLN